MLINKIVVACYKYDLFLLRICISSIRYWYPKVEIFLLKDNSRGSFSTKEIEKTYKVKSIAKPGLYRGYGYSKLEAFFLPFDKFLLLDADTIMVGKVLELLSQFNEDFIVTGVLDPDPNGILINKNYISVESIGKIYKEYVYPGYGINTGQMVITPGLISSEEIKQMFGYENNKAIQKHTDLLPYADQGIINFILAVKKAQNKISVNYQPFWLWPLYSEEVTFESQQEKVGEPFILHWAGHKPRQLVDFPRYDLLNFYNDIYYATIPFGGIKKTLRKVNTTIRLDKFKPRKKILLPES